MINHIIMQNIKEDIIYLEKSNMIKASMIIGLFKKNKIRNQLDIKNIFASIQTSFINPAECREYNNFIEKYQEIFRKKMSKMQ